MTEFKDHFSKQASTYAKYRPTYPEELFSYLASLTDEHGTALDCATGNGQAALGLTPFYQKVIAADASQAQIEKAFAHSKITYLVAPAESIPIESASVDLLTVASGLHWFDLDRFHREARRVLKPNGVIAAWVYNNIETDNEVEEIIRYLGKDFVGNDFPEEVRKWVWTGYETIPFPYQEIEHPDFYISVRWDLDALIGYLSSWSATQRYREKHGHDPIDLVRPKLESAMNRMGGVLERKWKLHLRVGRV